MTRLRSSFGWREPPLARVPSVPFSCRHSLYRSHSSLSLTPSLHSRSHSSSPPFFPLALSRALPFFPPLFLSFRRRPPLAPSYPRGNPREPLPFPARPPSSAPTAATRVYKLDQPGSTYLPFRIIRLACRPLLHAEFRLIKMILRGLSVVSATRGPWILIRISTERYCLNECYLFFVKSFKHYRITAENKLFMTT